MAKKFLGFTTDQQHKLLSKLGYTGPVDPKMMGAFIEATPAAANKMGNYQRLAQEKLNTPNLKLATGGLATTVANSVSDPTATAAATEAANTANVAAGANLTPESVKTGLDTAQATLAAAQKAATDNPSAANTAALTQAQNALQAAQTSFNTVGVPSTGEMASSALNNPSSLIPATQVERVATTTDQTVQEGTGQLGEAAPVAVKTMGPVAVAEAPKATEAKGVEASTISAQSKEAADKEKAVVGKVSEGAIVTAEQGTLSEGSLAKADTFNPEYLKLVTSGKLEVSPEELVIAQGQEEIAIATKIAEGTNIPPLVAVQGVVSANELPEAAQIKEADMAQAEIISSGGKLRDDAVAIAAKMEAFTVDNGTLAAAMQGEITARDTVQGQLENLLKSFNDGTPAWAAPALKAANGIMASRGLGRSSVAGAAILQAAMEAAVPIATADAKIFAEMNLQNLDNRQKVSLANALAQQGLELTNLDNEQKARLQNSANAFTLQTTDLSNQQQTVVANAQIRAALQGTNLNNQQQTNLAISARYAEMADLNLNNQQQVALQNNLNQSNLNLQNLSNKQQAYVANAQIEAALQGKQIDARQDAAIRNSARAAEVATLTFTEEQKSLLHNSELMATIGSAELSAKSAVTLQNALTSANMDITNLNNRQAAATQNSKAFLEMDLTNTTNEQILASFKAKAAQDALLSDQAAVNAALQFNAKESNQTDQFFAGLAESISRFNADQANSREKFNVGEENAAEQFNATLKAQREQFNANNSLVIAQANAKWRQDISLANTAAQNEANMNDAKNATSLTASAMDALWQRERDLMSFAFTSSESALDRKVQLMVADKSVQIAKMEENANEKQGIGNLVGTILGGLF